MAATKSKQIGYWITTLVVLLPTAVSGVPELLGHGQASVVQTMQTLGYPLYVMKILGLAKVLGAITLFVNRPARLVEWAYAGFSFLLLGATASHLLAGDAAHAAIPFCIFLVLMVSYALHREVRG